jgi:hypothetical protein
MWRPVVSTENLTEALKRGVLSAIDASPWNLVKLFCRMLAILVAYALILRLLEEALRLS